MAEIQEHDNVTESGYSVRIDNSLSEAQALQRLRHEWSRDHDDGLTNSDFCVYNCLTDPILDTLCQVFDIHGKRKPHRIYWKTLEIVDDDDDGEDFDAALLYHALRTANEASLFANIDLRISWNAAFRYAGIIANGAWVLPSLPQNHRLAQLKLSFDFDLSVNDTGCLCRTLQETTTLTDLVLDIPNCGDFAICAALGANQTLESISLHIQYERDARKLCRALIKNPKLKSVTLNNTVRESNLMESIRILLLLSNTTTCQLETLQMNYTVNSCHLEIDELIPVLANNQSLISFGTNWRLAGNQPFSRLLSTVQSHPTLNMLCLNQRFEIADLQEATTTTTTDLEVTKRIQLSNPKFGIPSSADDGNYYERALVAFLEAQAGVSFTAANGWPTSVAYANERNIAGRYLLRDLPPLGLWPLVLEKIGATKPTKKYGTSVVYEFLHDPALFARGT